MLLASDKSNLCTRATSRGANMRETPAYRRRDIRLKTDSVRTGRRNPDGRRFPDNVRRADIRGRPAGRPKLSSRRYRARHTARPSINAPRPWPPVSCSRAIVAKYNSPHGANLLWRLGADCCLPGYRYYVATQLGYGAYPSHSLIYPYGSG